MFPMSSVTLFAVVVLLRATAPLFSTDAPTPSRVDFAELAAWCSVDITSEASIQRYLEQGLRTEDAGGSRLTYKSLNAWNTVGVEIHFDNGTRVSGINVRIAPGTVRATLSMDFPEINASGVYYLTSDGTLTSSDGSFSYRCR